MAVAGTASPPLPIASPFPPHLLTKRRPSPLAIPIPFSNRIQKIPISTTRLDP
jgi:hypothetical protein